MADQDDVDHVYCVVMYCLYSCVLAYIRYQHITVHAKYGYRYRTKHSMSDMSPK